MTMQSVIACNYGDKTQAIQEFFCCFHPFTSNADAMKSMQSIVLLEFLKTNYYFLLDLLNLVPMVNIA